MFFCRVPISRMLICALIVALTGSCNPMPWLCPSHLARHNRLLYVGYSDVSIWGDIDFDSIFDQLSLLASSNAVTAAPARVVYITLPAASC